MKLIHARNVHQALPEALYQLDIEGVTSDSRNGPVRKFDEPVATVYGSPNERVMFWPQRDANPFFHLYESLWMLAGRNDVEPVARYVSTMRNYSDDGHTFHGAYGHRWRLHFGFDQLDVIIAALKADPTDRRQVLSMWDAPVDLGRKGKDLPCNLQALFTVNSSGSLDMIVTNRSNDIVWGAYGANAVHFSYLLEYVASSMGVKVGRYWQVSANFHVYTEKLDGVKDLAQVAPDPNLPAEMRWAGLCPYEDGLVEPFPLMTIAKGDWDEDLRMFLENPTVLGLRDPFFRKVAVPMHLAYNLYKELPAGPEKFTTPLGIMKQVKATDWQLAGEEWIKRRQEKFLRANDDGVAYE